MGTIPPLPPASTIHGTIAKPRKVITTELVIAPGASDFNTLLKASLAEIQSKTYNHEIMDIKYSITDGFIHAQAGTRKATQYSALIIYTTTEYV